MHQEHGVGCDSVSALCLLRTGVGCLTVVAGPVTDKQTHSPMPSPEIRFVHILGSIYSCLIYSTPSLYSSLSLHSSRTLYVLGRRMFKHSSEKPCHLSLSISLDVLGTPVVWVSPLTCRGIRTPGCLSFLHANLYPDDNFRGWVMFVVLKTAYSSKAGDLDGQLEG